VIAALDASGPAGKPLGAIAVRGYAEPVRIWELEA
jgi:hypothetical protein